MDIAKQSARLQQLRTNAAILNNTKAQEAARAVKGIAMLSEEDVAELAPIMPELPLIRKYTEEEIIANAHGEIRTICNVRQQLSDYLESRLAYYEGKL